MPPLRPRDGLPLDPSRDQPLGQRLAGRREVRLPALSLCWDRLWGASDPRARFLANMVELYHYVRMSCPLMAAALARLDQPDDAIGTYLRRHIEEEHGHDRWVLDDLAKLGFAPAAVAAGLPRRETMALVGAQLYLIQEIEPRAILGYIYALESSTPPTETVAFYSEAFDIPPAALFSFQEHATLDWEHHVDDLTVLLDRAVTDPKLCDLIEHSYVTTMELLADLALAIAEDDAVAARLEALRGVADSSGSQVIGGRPS